jgi:hypothetical protein
MPEEKLLAELERIVAEQDRQSAGNGRRSVNAIADVFNESLALPGGRVTAPAGLLHCQNPCH